MTWSQVSNLHPPISVSVPACLASQGNTNSWLITGSLGIFMTSRISTEHPFLWTVVGVATHWCGKSPCRHRGIKTARGCKPLSQLKLAQQTLAHHLQLHSSTAMAFLKVVAFCLLLVVSASAFSPATLNYSVYGGADSTAQLTQAGQCMTLIGPEGADGRPPGHR